MHSKVIRQPCVINWVAWKRAFRIPLTHTRLRRLSKHRLSTRANTHLWPEWVGEKRGKSISWILDFIMRVKKQLCCGPFFNDPESTCMNLLAAAVCVICEGILAERKKRERGETFPQGVLKDYETRLRLRTWTKENPLDNHNYCSQEKGQVLPLFQGAFTVVSLMNQ